MSSDKLLSWFRDNQIQFADAGCLNLGFGHGQDQYQFYDYPAPHHSETMGIFFEWDTADFFEAPSNPHLAVGLWGPKREDPHRGRGLALGLFAGFSVDPEGNKIQQFSGGPPPPGGGAMFIEDFTVNEEDEDIAEWQLTQCRLLPELSGCRKYRVHLLVSKTNVWAAVWQVLSGGGYQFIDQTSCSQHPPKTVVAQPYYGEQPSDRGVGNAFVGHGFASPTNKSRIEWMFIAHGVMSLPNISAEPFG